RIRKSASIARVTATTPTASQNPNRNTARILTSRLRATGSPASGRSVVRMRERLQEFRVPGRQERVLLQLPEKDGEPHATDPDRRGEIEPGHLEARRRGGGRRLREDRADQPVDIHEAHENDERRDAGEDPRVSVGPLREKEQERQREVEEHEGGADPTPASGEPPQVP